MSFTMEQAEESAKSFNKAMKGFGTDEGCIIRELATHTNGQRQLIKQKYLALYGKTLEEAIKSEINGHFKKGALALLEPVDEYEARLLKEAMHGAGTNEKIVIQILCPKEAHEIEILKAAYKRLYGKDLDKDISHEEGGVLGRLFRSLASAGRSQSIHVDYAQAKHEAEQLYSAGAGKFGTDESEFMRILCSRSFPQLDAIFHEYSVLYGEDIEKAIKSEMSGDLERACLAIVRAAKNKLAYYAHELHDAMAGVGTSDDDLIRLLVSQSENDLQGIKNQYNLHYGRSLHDAIKSELSGDYEKLFVELIGK